MEMSGILPFSSVLKFNDKPVVIAGPCSAESREQVLLTAESLSKHGITLFRAGVWKPRTKPGGFEGVGEEALPWLAEVKAKTGMQVSTEIANGEHLRKAVDAGVDIVWLGARTVANPFAVQEIADEWSKIDDVRKFDIGVLVKNPVNPDLDLWIGAFERLYNAGVRRLGAVHRGFSAYKHPVYRNPPEWRIPIEFKRRYPQIPIICDPSHISGDRKLVSEVSRQAVNLCFDGLMIEVHCSPSSALSDAKQQLTPEELIRMLNCLAIPEDKDSGNVLHELRKEIDLLDDKLIDVLSQRMDVARKIGEFKRRNEIRVVQKERYESLVTERVRNAAKIGLDEDFVKRLLSVVHEESVRVQLEDGRNGV